MKDAVNKSVFFGCSFTNNPHHMSTVEILNDDKIKLREKEFFLTNKQKIFLKIESFVEELFSFIKINRISLSEYEDTFFSKINFVKNSINDYLKNFDNENYNLNRSSSKLNRTNFSLNNKNNFNNMNNYVNSSFQQNKNVYNNNNFSNLNTLNNNDYVFNDIYSNNYNNNNNYNSFLGLYNKKYLHQDLYL
jgi:hypothetical protein